jgi:hypothetical protein
MTFSLRNKRFLFRSLATVVVFLACLFEVALAQEKPQATAVEKPNKQQLIETLKSYLSKLKSEDYEGAASHLVIPSDIEFKPKMIKGFENSENISLPGIERLAKEAKFGRSKDQFGESLVKRYASLVGADVTETYGFKFKAEDGTAEVIAKWQDGKFKLIRIDDIRRIEYPKKKILPPVFEAPSKEALIATLVSIQNCLDDENYKAAVTHLKVSEKFYPPMLKSLIEDKTISAEGIEVLKRDAKFGKALEIVEGYEAKALVKVAKQKSVKLEACYGFAHSAQGVESLAIAVWDKDHFRIIRLEAVGKLQANLGGQSEQKP